MTKHKKLNKTTSFGETIGFSQIFHNEKLNFMIGLISLIVAIYMTMSFISFFTTGSADQSLIEVPRTGEIMNEKGEFMNNCGSIGAYTAYFFVKRSFGIAAFFIPAFLLLISLKLMRVYIINLSKWFICTMIVMIWASVTLAKFIAPLFKDSSFNTGGDHGQYISKWIENLVGAPGLTALLCLVAIGFLTYISAETIYVIRRMLNPVKFFTDRVKFEISNDKEQKEEKNNTDADIINATDIVEEPDAFENPEAQTIDFNETDIAQTNTSEAIEIKQLEEQEELSEPSDTTRKNKEPELNIITGKNEEKARGKNLVNNNGEKLAPYDPKLDLENYHYPTLDLLKKYDNDGKPYIDMAEQTANKNRIVEVLRNFGVEISSIKATVGPTITLYEITPHRVCAYPKYAILKMT